ncbi:MAG: NTP transferase domain-containing protein [Acidobacteriota bacterium]
MVRSIVLAAGSSTRMGQPKALLKVHGSTFLGRILRNHRAVGLPVTVVLGEHEAQIRAAVDLSEAAVVLNPHPENGPLSSLRIGLGTSAEDEAVIVHPVDHPLVCPDTLQALLDVHGRSPDRIVVPEFGARRGHPVLFPRLFFEELRAAPLDQGARYVVRRHAGSVLTVKVRDEGVIQNIDTPEDYDRLIRSVKAD